MKLEMIVTCDAAADYNGKTCIMGTFDTIFAEKAPVTHSHLAIVVKIRFQPSEGVIHKAAITFVDPDSKPLFPAAEGRQDLSVPFEKSKRSVIATFIFNIDNLKLTKFGEHKVNLVVDGHQLGEQSVFFDERPDASVKP